MYEKSTIVLANTITAQERATECSLRIAWIFGKHKRSFTDAEIVKECMLETADTLFDDKQKNEINDRIKQIPLSDSTSMTRTELLAVDLMSQLDQGLKKAPCISLAIDESTDSTDNAQLIFFVRYYDAGEKKICQDLLGVTDLKGRARGEDIYGSLKSMLESRNIDIKSIISVTTDGAPAMVGRKKGLVARLKEDNSDMISYHCIIHQSVLCASLGDEYGEVMETIMKQVNFLRSTSALQHRLLRTFLTEVNASYDDLLVDNNVRWLSKGKVLERFCAIRKELQTFLEDQNSVKAKAFSEFLKDNKKIESVGFLADIMSHLNDLNVKLQGEKHTISNLISAIQAFQKKIELLKDDIQSQLFHFPRILEERKDETDTKYV
ncbi:protein FAM200A-like [Palaemon carinicauda]|uniref:protein FAM200A-like n=1 Tax=Palaemon carinicauda TaxID=392227 RepID=UPI0035B61974